MIWQFFASSSVTWRACVQLRAEVAVEVGCLFIKDGKSQYIFQYSSGCVSILARTLKGLKDTAGSEKSICMVIAAKDVHLRGCGDRA